MGEGEHTIIGKIPRERLNQIASRKLSALGVPVRLAADRETLEGELAFQRLPHPATGQPITRARFAVVGHDQLRFLDAPLAALGEMSFYEHERVAALEQAIAAALAQRAAGLHEIELRLRALHLDAAVDPDRLAVRAIVKTQSHAFELLGGPEGVRVSRVAPVGGQPFEVPIDFPPLAIGELHSAAEVETYLADGVSRMRPAPEEPRPAASPTSTGAVEATPPSRNALTLADLVRAFGDDAVLAPNAAVELIQEFQHGGTRYRFVASREMGTRFKGRLIGPSGDVWAERFDLARFPGTHRVVAVALEAPEAVELPSPVDAAAEGGGSAELPQHLLPHPGEIWVMNVVIEEAGQDEVRYVGTDIDGRPYGAARILKRSDFEAVFNHEQGTWRLLVQVDQVQEGNVIYRQLDRSRQPVGAPRRMAAAILVANFVPEAAAY